MELIIVLQQYEIKDVPITNIYLTNYASGLCMPEIAAMGVQVAGVAAQIREDALAFAVDLRLVAPAPEQGAQRARLVADGIAGGIAGHDLMDRSHPLSSNGRPS